jgi:tetratricopeptide (TPR) repeat protein
LPTNAEAKAKIADSFLQRGVLDEAMAELGALGDLHAAKGRPDEAVIAYSRGAEVAAAVGNFKRATDFFDAAVLVEPDSDAVRHAAVAFFLRIGAVDRAVRQLWEVVRIALNGHDPDEAVAALHQIIALTPQDPAAYHKLGEVLASLGEYSQAEKVYRRLAGLTPDDPVLAAKQAALSALAMSR